MLGFGFEALGRRAWILKSSFKVLSRKLTWKPKKGPIKTTVSLQRGYMGFHVSLGECTPFKPTYPVGVQAEKLIEPRETTCKPHISLYT